MKAARYESCYFTSTAQSLEEVGENHGSLSTFRNKFGQSPESCIGQDTVRVRGEPGSPGWMIAHFGKVGDP
jgi:hypothetical protein